MKVALVNDWFLKYVAEQAVGIKSAGADVMVVCRDHFQEFNGNREEWQGCIDSMHNAGVETLIVRGRMRSLTAARTGVAATRRLRAWRPDVVHAHPNRDPWLHMVSTGFPLVLTIHDPVAHPGQPVPGRVERAVGNAWRARAEGFVVHGESLRVLTRPMVGRRPIAVVPHGLQPAPQAYPIPPSDRILFFGRLEPYKGIGVLVEAIRQVWEQRPHVVLVIAGQGPAAALVPEHPQIERRFGYIPEADVDGLFASSTLVVAPYTEASQSGVVALATARGIPTVVSNQGALSDLVVEPGLVVPAGDSNALAGALVRYLDHDMELRHRVHAFATDELSWGATGRRALELYPKLAFRKGPKGSR